MICKMQVPEWNTYFPSLSFASNKQNQFYSKLISALKKDRKVEIEGNLSYIFVYLYNVIEEFIESENIEPLVEKFERIYLFYGSNEKISQYISLWLKDAYLYNNDFNNAWKYTRISKVIKVEDLIYIRGKCEETNISGEDIGEILGSKNGLTKFGQDNIDHIIKLAGIFLEDFYFVHGKNYADYFLKNFDYGNLKQNQFNELKEYYSNEQEYIKWNKDYIQTQKSKYPFPKYYKHFYLLEQS